MENLPKNELEDGKITGDMNNGEKHFIVADSPSLGRNWFGFIHRVKWEGFSSSFSDDFKVNEKANEIFMSSKEAERDVSPDWCPTKANYMYDGASYSTEDASQKLKGASFWSSVGEGCYKMRMAMERSEDATQTQQFEVNFEVKLKVHDDFLKGVDN